MNAYASSASLQLHVTAANTPLGSPPRTCRGLASITPMASSPARRRWPAIIKRCSPPPTSWAWRVAREHPDFWHHYSSVCRKSGPAWPAPMSRYSDEHAGQLTNTCQRWRASPIMPELWRARARLFHRPVRGIIISGLPAAMRATVDFGRQPAGEPGLARVGDADEHPTAPGQNGTSPRQWNLQSRKQSAGCRCRWAAVLRRILHKAVWAPTTLVVAWLQDRPARTRRRRCDADYLLSPYYPPLSTTQRHAVFREPARGAGVNSQGVGSATLLVNAAGTQATLSLTYTI